MRAIAGIIFIIGIICLLGLPFIGVMIFLSILMALGNFALGNNKGEKKK